MSTHCELHGAAAVRNLRAPSTFTKDRIARLAKRRMLAVIARRFNASHSPLHEANWLCGVSTMNTRGPEQPAEIKLSSSLSVSMRGDVHYLQLSSRELSSGEMAPSAAVAWEFLQLFENTLSCALQESTAQALQHTATFISLLCGADELSCSVLHTSGVSNLRSRQLHELEADTRML